MMLSTLVLPWSHILYGSLVGPALGIVLLWMLRERDARTLAAVATSACAGTWLWNTMLNVRHGGVIDGDIPFRPFPISWQDTAPVSSPSPRRRFCFSQQSVPSTLRYMQRARPATPAARFTSGSLRLWGSNFVVMHSDVYRVSADASRKEPRSRGRGATGLFGYGVSPPICPISMGFKPDFPNILNRARTGVLRGRRRSGRPTRFVAFEAFPDVWGLRRARHPFPTLA